MLCATLKETVAQLKETVGNDTKTVCFKISIITVNVVLMDDIP